MGAPDPRDMEIRVWVDREMGGTASERRARYKAARGMSLPAATAMLSFSRSGRVAPIHLWRLERAGIAAADTLGELADRSRTQMLDAPGVGPSLLALMGESLARAGVATDWGEPPPPEDCPHCGQPMPPAELLEAGGFNDE